MKHYFFLFLFIICALSALCQPRVNSSDRYKIVAQSQPITNPVGWSYSTYDEKWCGCYGICLGEYKRNSKTPRQLTQTICLDTEIKVYILSILQK